MLRRPGPRAPPAPCGCGSRRRFASKASGINSSWAFSPKVPGSTPTGTGAGASPLGSSPTGFSTSFGQADAAPESSWVSIDTASGDEGGPVGSRGAGGGGREPSGAITDAFREQYNRNKFRLSRKFVDKYQDRKPPFGFNGLGELVYQRTYARTMDDGKKEQWYQTVERVVNGTYNMQKRWIEGHQLGWNPWRAQVSAQEMYERIFEMKFLPPGRGLWAMGSAITEERMLFAALNNCAFVSTDRMKESPARPFCFLMDASMLGVGVGFDTRGAGTVVVKGPEPRIDNAAAAAAAAVAGAASGAGTAELPSAGASDGASDAFVVPDSREGWVYSLALLLDSYFLGKPEPVFDYSAVRPAGMPIRGFGGVTSGPEVLEQLHESVRGVLRPLIGGPLTVTAIVDIMNMIGRCVVSANVRRTAEIAFGDPHSDEYIDLKNYEVNPHRADYGWTSNNSVFAELGMDYGPACDRVRTNGEPGFAWLENMQQYSRMGRDPDGKDHRARGGNPCLEQTLESYELCCLVETFPNNHDSLEDYKRTLKFAYLYAKTVTLGRTHWPVTNRVMMRNRRIGCSLSGVAQLIADRGIDEARQWCEAGYDTIQHYDKVYSDWLAIPRSIKTTSVKPSGTVSLLAGATPGMHYPESRFYLRRVRLGRDSELLEPLRRAGYEVEPAVGDDSVMVVSFPVDVGAGVRTVRDVSMWEQLSLAAFLQEHWADNQVSCTVSFDAEREGSQLEHALNYFQYKLKGVSFLPRLSAGAYPQMPYEEIDEATYGARVAGLGEIDFSGLEGPDSSMPDKFCDTAQCEIEPPVSAVAGSGAVGGNDGSVEGYLRLLEESGEDEEDDGDRP